MKKIAMIMIMVMRIWINANISKYNIWIIYIMSLPLNQHRWIETGFYVKYKGRPKNRKKSMLQYCIQVAGTMND